MIEREAEFDGLPPPTGPYSWVVSYGGLVYVSGLRGIEVASGKPAARQERRLELIFAHLKGILAASGSSPEDVLVTRVYLTDMAGLRPLVNDAFVSFFGRNLPTRTIVEVAALNQGDSIEIEVVAAKSAVEP